MNVLLIGIMVYVLVQLIIGLIVSRHIRSESDYLLAGRRLGVGLAAFSIFATWFGAETVVGAAGAIYQDGLSGGSADPFGYAICLILFGVVFAMPLWRRRLTTFADLFRERFSPGVERLTVLLLIPTSIMWAAAQIRAFGQVVSATSDIDVSVAISVAAVIVIVYTVAGGLMADVVTDFVQGIALIIGLVVLALAVLTHLGGAAAATAAIDPARFHLFNGPWLETVEAWAIPICGSILAQELVARVLACRSASVARRAALFGGGMYLVLGLIPVYLGLIGPGLLPGLAEPEQLMPTLAQQYLSTFVYILFAGALISAILSTVDSALLASAGLLSHNLVLPLVRAPSERLKLAVARAGVVLFGVLAYVLALHAEGVYELVVTASAFGSAGVFVVAMFGLFTRTGGALSAYGALIVGIVVWGVGEFILDLTAPYLLSIAAAGLSYVGLAAWDRLRVAVRVSA